LNVRLGDRAGDQRALTVLLDRDLARPQIRIEVAADMPLSAITSEMVRLPNRRRSSSVSVVDFRADMPIQPLAGGFGVAPVETLYLYTRLPI
jgi:hypothetical protein